MFCRFCGKAIQEDSEFCPYCGKVLGIQQTNFATSTHKPDITPIDIHTLSKLSSICFYVGIIVFYILFPKMSPGTGGFAYIIYIGSAGLVLATAVIVNKIRGKAHTRKMQFVALVFGLFLLLSSLTLRIIYECKVDDAVADIPKSGTVHLDVKIDEEFYSYYYEGLVRDPYSRITIDGQEDSPIHIELNQAYTAKITAGYAGRSGVAASAASGSTSKRITFTQSNLQNGYTMLERVSLGGGFAEVTVKFKRICTFWEVIFYNPV